MTLALCAPEPPRILPTRSEHGTRSSASSTGGLVCAFATAWLTAEEIQTVYELAGYAVAALVGFRIVWGFVGSRYARFAHFVRGPAATLTCVADIARGRDLRYLGHNPAGAAMIIAVLVTLSGSAFTGWLMKSPVARKQQRGSCRWSLRRLQTTMTVKRKRATAATLKGRNEGPLKEVHETLANAMLLLVALHLGGVALTSFRHRENLARAMVTGRKRIAGPGDIV